MILILAFFYLTANSGVVVNIHYCMGKISDVKVAAFPKKGCVCGKDKIKMKCCGSEIKLVKLSETHKTSEISSVVKLVTPAFSQPLNLLNTPVLNSTIQFHKFYGDSPPLSDQDTYLHNCVFRI